MALIKCKECGKEISNTAKVCINCGAKTEQYDIKQKKLKKIIWIVIIIAIIILFSIAVRKNDLMYQYSREAINLIENYKNGNITKSEVISELDSISYKADNESKKEENESKQIKWDSLYALLSSFSTAIEAGTVDNVDLNNYMKELKKF